MKYATAQLVHSRSFEVSAINVYLHRYKGELDIGVEPVVQIEKISQNPGELVGLNLRLPPGGNAVNAYLDIVSEHLDVATADALLSRFAVTMKTKSSSEVVRADATGIVRCYVHPQLDALVTFEQLAEAIKSVVANPVKQAPLTIKVRREGEDVSVFQLDDLSTERLKVIHGLNWQAPRIQVSDDNYHDFQALYGDIFEHLIDAATGLDRIYIKRLGGVRFLFQTGQEYRWPPEGE